MTYLKKLVFNKKGEIDFVLTEPMRLLLFVILFVTLFTLVLQNNNHKNYHQILDEMARTHLLKPMEENGGLTDTIWNNFQSELIKRNIPPQKVELIDATWYPIDRGEPVEVIINSSYPIRALAYIGGPKLNRPTMVRKIGVSQRFFR